MSSPADTAVPPSAPLQRGAWTALVALSLMFFLLMAGTFNSLGQVLPSMVKDLDMNWSQAGLGFALLGLACGGASPLPALGIRWLGVRTTLALGALVLALSFAAMAVAGSASVYYAGAFALGVGFCLVGPIPAVDVLGSVFGARQSLAIGIYFAVGNVGAVCGPLMFYTVHQLTGGWRSYWLLWVAASIAVGAFAAIAAGNAAHAARRAGAEAAGTAVARVPLRDLFRHMPLQFWVLAGAYTTCLAVDTIFHSFVFQHLMERGVTQGLATGAMSGAAAVAAIASALGGAAGQKLPARFLTIVSLLALAASMVILTLPTGVATVLGFVVAFGCGVGVCKVAVVEMLRGWFNDALLLELYAVMTWVATAAALGPSVGGRLRDATGTFAPIFDLSALGCVGIVILLALVRRPRSSVVTDSPAIAA
ncbi:MFS transporter [Novosphingobium nitrogenifigens]|nr:MFS transporter [Novosphingobium nitrogenifigens]